MCDCNNCNDCAFDEEVLNNEVLAELVKEARSLGLIVVNEPGEQVEVDTSQRGIETDLDDDYDDDYYDDDYDDEGYEASHHPDGSFGDYDNFGNADLDDGEQLTPTSRIGNINEVSRMKGRMGKRKVKGVYY